MIMFLGCALMGLIFLVLTTGNPMARVNQSMEWVHAWAPYSYILIAMVVASAIVSIVIIQRWPKHVEPEDPMAKYRRGEDVVEED